MSFKKYGSKFLSGLRSYRVKQADEASAIESYLQSLDHPRALAVWLLYRENEHNQIVELEFDPLHYNDVGSLRSAYCATKFLSKFKGLRLSYDLDEVAFTKFSEFENLCKETNSRFRFLERDPLYSGDVVYLHHAVTRKISKILGEFSAADFFLDANWGPGASTLIKRRRSSPVNKFQNEIGITRDLYSLLPTGTFELVYPHWGQHLDLQGFPHFQVGNKVVTVPKDASTHRVIAIEPGINSWFQKSIGETMMKKLSWVGVDLRDQTVNQKLARQGSISGKLATVDLRSASDSVALAVVRELLPPKWFSVMDSCRSHFGTLKDETIKWEKFSSMGNGFTFPLQSLIFYAVSKCCAEYVNAEETVSVYGDDIILPISAFKLFSRMMDFYGFRINMKKTYVDSMFRESCGAHWFEGVDVKPLYLKDKVSSIPAVFRLANAVRRLAHRECNYIACDARFRPTFELLERMVPKAFRLKIPNTLGDGGFISNFDEATPSRARHHIEGYVAKHVTDSGNYYLEDKPGYLLAELWRLSTRSGGSRVDILPTGSTRTGVIPTRLQAIREITELDSDGLDSNKVNSGVSKLALSYSLVQQWYDLGPWVS
jgi:hypothetical protein